MKLGIVVYSDDSETVWNALRFGVYAQVMGDAVKMFLIGKGVRMELLGTEDFKVKEQLKTFLESGGKMFACKTCLEIHAIKPSASYTVSTLKDLSEIVKESERVLTF